MEKLRLLLFVALVLLVVISGLYIPQNQLRVHRGSARLEDIHIEDNTYGFKFAQVNTRKGTQSTRTPPFLFVHGHKGSVKQAISMTVYFEKHGLPLNMYSVDFLEAAVGLSHTLLHEEAQFVNKCLVKIAERHPEEKIGIIAHSMGGIVASLAMAMPGAPLNKIFTMVCLSSPVNAHPVNSYLALPLAYAQVHEFWLEDQSDHIFILSVTGGVRDLIVPSSLTNIDELMSKNGLHFYSTAIKKLNLEMDHDAIVWGAQFFNQLCEALKLIIGGMTSKQPLRELFQTDISQTINDTPALPAEKGNTVQVLKEGTQTLELNTSYMLVGGKVAVQADKQLTFAISVSSSTVDERLIYILDASQGVSLSTLEENQVVVQKLTDEYFDLSFTHAVFGYEWRVNSTDKFVIHMRPGPSFSQPRYPLRIGLHGEGQLKAAYARCGLEEIVKYNEHEFILFFSESCEDGPDIWLVGFDQSVEYSLELRVDKMGSLISMLRDFRVTIFSSMLFLGVLSCKKDYKMPLRLAVLLLLYLFSCYFRIFGGLCLDHVHNHHQHLGFVDLIFLYLGGEALFAVFSATFGGLCKLGTFISKKAGLLPFLSVPALYFFPWPVTLALTVYTYSVAPSVHKQLLRYSFFQLTTALPQIISWFVIIQDHGVVETLNIYDALSIGPNLLLLAAIIYSQRECNAEKELTVIGAYLGLCCFDLMYRANLVMAIGSVVLATKLFLTGKKPEEYTY